jgi:hypothetical protein
MLAKISINRNIFIPKHLDMADFSWSEFLAGSSFAAITQEAIRYYRRKTEARVDMAANTKDIADVHRIMETVVRETFFDRFILFYAEDSSGVLAAGKNLYVTAQYEKINNQADETLQTISEDIVRWKADVHYYDLFSEMLTKGSLTVKTELMPDSKLKDIYVAQKIKTSKIYHLMTTKDSSKVFYCSVASTVVDEAKPECRVIINSAIDKLTDIFSRHKKFY